MSTYPTISSWYPNNELGDIKFKQPNMPKKLWVNSFYCFELILWIIAEDQSLHIVRSYAPAYINTIHHNIYCIGTYLELKPAALTAVIGRAPSPATAPVIGRPIDDGIAPRWAVPNLACPIGIFPVGYNINTSWQSLKIELALLKELG